MYETTTYSKQLTKEELLTLLRKAMPHIPDDARFNMGSNEMLSVTWERHP